MRSDGARSLPSDVTVRRVRAADWQQVRALRIEALHDPVANVAFLETVAAATARPDAEWQERAERNAEGATSAQFVAERDGELLGTLTVFVRAAGEPDYFGRRPEVELPTVVSVFVSQAGRGHGLIDALLDEAATWSRGRGDVELTLDVHESNAVAIRAYERAGFQVVGSFVGEHGRELGMAKKLVVTDPA